MAQYTIHPPTTRKELDHAAGLVRAAMRERGIRTLEFAARSMGMPYSDLSRLLRAKVERKWGYFRLARVASWLGVTLDGLLGRPAGTTRILSEGTTVPASTPPPLWEQAQVLSLAGQIADAKLELAGALKQVVPDQGRRRRVLQLVDLHVARVIQLWANHGRPTLEQSGLIVGASQSRKREEAKR